MLPVTVSGLRLMRYLLPICVVACILPGSGLAQTVGPAPKPIESRIQTILAEAKSIDAADEAPDNAERRHAMVDFPHWQFTGLFDNGNPMFLSATFSQDRVVRQESYYLLHDKSLLVKVLKWSDVEEPATAPEPPINQVFYLEDSRIIRRVIKIGSGRRRTLDEIVPGEPLEKRASVIANILLGHSRDGKLTEPLESFPEAELPQK